MATPSLCVCTTCSICAPFFRVRDWLYSDPPGSESSTDLRIDSAFQHFYCNIFALYSPLYRQRTQQVCLLCAHARMQSGLFSFLHFQSPSFSRDLDTPQVYRHSWARTPRILRARGRRGYYIKSVCFYNGIRRLGCVVHNPDPLRAQVCIQVQRKG